MYLPPSSPLQSISDFGLPNEIRVISIGHTDLLFASCKLWMDNQRRGLRMEGARTGSVRQKLVPARGIRVIQFSRWLLQRGNSHR